MEDLGRMREWLEAGKQVGKSILSGEGGETFRISVGVQKWEGEYTLYLFKAKECSLQGLDYYDVEGVIRVTHFEGLAGLLPALCPIKLSELAPLKGQKIFNPAFD
jgi:hypothetical protein